MPNSVVFSDNPEQLKTQIYGINSSTPKAIQTDADGNLITKLSTADGTDSAYSVPLTAFYDLRSTTLTPMAGWTFNYNINTDYIIATSTNGGTITQANSMAELSTSTATHGAAKINTRKILRYSPGLGALVRFTAIFTTGVSNSKQIIGLGDESDGFFFGYNGSAFSILRISNSISYWTPQTAWNVDVMNGSGPSKMTLDPTKGNVYAIEFQWLGFGVINFFLTSTTTGQPILVHRIQYPNTDTVPSVYNPNFPLTASIVNSGNNKNLTLKTPCAMAFCEGDAYSTAIITRNSASATTIPFSAAQTNINILTLLNTNTFASKTNRTRIRLDFLSTSNDSSKPVSYKLIRNADFSSPVNYTSINSNTSVIKSGTTTTTVNSGTNIFAFKDPANNASQLFVSQFNIFLAPGETLTLSATTNANNTQLFCSMSWEELW